MTMDISNFHLNTPLALPKIFCIKLSDIPLEIVQEYKLKDIATDNRYVYVKATKGMYGLHQAKLLAKRILSNNH